MQSSHFKKTDLIWQYYTRRPSLFLGILLHTPILPRLTSSQNYLLYVMIFHIRDPPCHPRSWNPRGFVFFDQHTCHTLFTSPTRDPLGVRACRVRKRCRDIVIDRSDKHCTLLSTPLGSCLGLPSPSDYGVGGIGVGLAATTLYECPPLLAEFGAETRVYDDVDGRVDH